MSDAPLISTYMAIAVGCIVLIFALRLISGERSTILSGLLHILGRSSLIVGLGLTVLGMVRRFVFADDWVPTAIGALPVAFLGGLFAHQLWILTLYVREDLFGPKQG